MTKNIFLLLGGNKLNFGILKKFQKKGYRVFVVDWNQTPQMTGDKHYRIDVKDPNAIMAALKKDGLWEQVAFAYSSIDLAVPSVTKLNKYLGFSTISDESLAFATSKSQMTKRWNEAGLLNRISRKYTSFEPGILELNKTYKLIVKPDNSASSRGITIVPQNTDENILKQAVQKALEEASNHTAVIEEFVEGTEFTVEMIGDAHGHVSVYAISKKSHTKNTDNNKIAVKLHYNALSDELQHKIANYAVACYKALGFSSSLGHLEVLLKQDGTFSPVEIGARSSGFIASDLVDAVSGADFLEDLMQVQRGGLVEDGLHPQTEISSMYFFYDFPEGAVVKKECGLTDFTDAPITSRYFDRSNIVLGKRFQKIDNDNARLGFEILIGPKALMTPDYIAHKEQEMLESMLGGTYAF